MPSDTEPRYRLVDSNGNVVGSLYAEADGTLKLQEGTSGSDNEVSVATDGTFSAPAVSTEKSVTDKIGGTVVLSTDQTVANDTFTPVEFDVVDTDNLNEWDGTNFQIVADRDATYFVSILFRWDGGSFSDGDPFSVQFSKNGGSAQRAGRHDLLKHTAQNESIRLTHKYENVSAGDELKPQVRQQSGGSQTIRGAGTVTGMQWWSQ